MNYKGSCHCGKIAFEVDGEIGKLIECNCTICRRRGDLASAAGSPQGTKDEALSSSYPVRRLRYGAISRQIKWRSRNRSYYCG